MAASAGCIHSEDIFPAGRATCHDTPVDPKTNQAAFWPAANAGLKAYPARSLFRLQLREKNHVADAFLRQQHHAQTVKLRASDEWHIS
jgi:hypothetical protein